MRSTNTGAIPATAEECPLTVPIAGQCCPNLALRIFFLALSIVPAAQRLSGTLLGGYFVLDGRLRAFGDDRGSDGT
jgi:hypothetical protein